jgi:catechol 2,3-dioxygenase-like lactoylglutathione lyase family enzyme
MGINRVQVISVPVSDQQRAKAFYTDVLGFDVQNDMPMGPDSRWIQLAPPGGETSITLVTWFEKMPAGCLTGTVLNTDDIQKTYDEFSARGLKWNGPIEEQFWGTFATFDDPDGNNWVVATIK